MEYTIKAHSSREQLTLSPSDEPIPEQLKMYEEEKYTFRVCIKLYVNSRLAVSLYGIVFDEETIENDGEDLDDVADMIDGDVQAAIAYLIGSPIFDKELDENLAFDPPYDCYIQNYFISPKFQGSGIEEYLFKNLYDIFFYCFNTHIRCFVTYPKPQGEDRNGDWFDIPDEDGKIRTKMIQFHEKMGYKPIKNTGFYAINCMS